MYAKEGNQDKMKIVEVYVYGNGYYAKPFWTRVQEKIDERSYLLCLFTYSY